MTEYKEYREFLRSIINRIEEIGKNYEDADDEHHAFDYLIAELFETTDEERGFVFTDKPNDQGIDFYIADPDSHYYGIYQCKFPSLDTLEKTPNKPQTFGKKAVDELRRAISYLLGPVPAESAKEEIKSLRSNIKREIKDREGDELELNFTLAVFGELTKGAEEEFKRLKEEYRNNKNIRIRLLQWGDIIEELSPPKKKGKIKIFLDIEEKSYSGFSDYCYCLAYATGFYEAFKKHKWDLFDLNVRYELKKSRINKKIINTLKSSKRKKFHHYNNGILIVASSYKCSDDKRKITLTNPQIINGCQTVVSIWRAYRDLSDDEKEQFDKECKVQVKIIKHEDKTKDLINELVITTNDQNPMSPRNLKSNLGEQKKIKEKFSNLPFKWFYQRKDEEFEGLKTIRDRNVKLNDFKGETKYRVVDNKELAKAWYSFIGFSHITVMGSKLFEDEKTYEQIFLRVPKEDHWKLLTDHQGEIRFHQENFEYRTPSAEEYLLAYLIYEFVKEYSVSSPRNKKEALERGRNKGELTENSTPADQAKYLEKVYAYILCKKYGAINGSLASKILKLEGFDDLVKNPDFKKYIEKIEKLPDEEKRSHILWSIYEFLRYCLECIYPEMKKEYLLGRKKVFLAKRDTINRFKKKIDETNKEVRGILKPFLSKENIDKRTFLDSLPPLS